MKLPLRSFLLGYGAGACTVFCGRWLRPLVLELASVLFRLMGPGRVRGAMKLEEHALLLARARTRAHRLLAPPRELARAWAPSPAPGPES